MSENLFHLICARATGRNIKIAARVDVCTAAAILGFAESDIPVLVGAKMLKPLGKPAPNSPKKFALGALAEHALDRVWLHNATMAVAKHWANHRKAGSDREPKKAGPAGANTPITESITDCGAGARPGDGRALSE